MSDPNQSNRARPERLSRRTFTKLSSAYAAGLAAFAARPLKADDAPIEYIVVGSGPGGGPLAVNLAKAGHKVVLFEAGPGPADYSGVDPFLNLFIEVPLFSPLVSTDPQISWEFYVRHYADQAQQMKDTKFVPAGTPNASNPHGGIYYPRASTIGGCGTHNVLVMLYPSNSDFDNIANSTGDSSWSAANMRQYFERLENCGYLIQSGSRHGTTGWQPTEMVDSSIYTSDPQLLDIMQRAVPKLGHPGDLDLLAQNKLDPNNWNIANNDVPGLYSFPVSRLNGKRYGVREHVLEAAALMPDKLIVKTNCLVTRVLFDADNNATGVEYIEGGHVYRASPLAPQTGALPATTQMSATREVILAGGTFNSPQLLKLSGVGPGSELSSFGIPLVSDIEGVGQNMQDRYEIGVVSQLKSNLALLSQCRPGTGPTDPCLQQWFGGQGPYTTNLTVLGDIRKSNPTRPERDLVVFIAAGRFRGYYPGWPAATLGTSDQFTWLILKAHTVNRAGTVMLRSADPRDVPEINFHYFKEGTDSAGQDLDSVVEGVKLARSINAQLGNIIKTELVPGPLVNGTKDIADFIANEAWGHHASCSNKMGPRANGGVVDSNFKVYGTNRLRLVDASVFPQIPGYYPMIPIMMMSEKASDVILADI